jgi:hypothetical protein
MSASVAAARAAGTLLDEGGEGREHVASKMPGHRFGGLEAEHPDEDTKAREEAPLRLVAGADG